MPETENAHVLARLLDAIQKRDQSLNHSYNALLQRIQDAEALLSSSAEEAQKQRVGVAAVSMELQSELEAVRAALESTEESQARVAKLEREVLDRSDALQAAQQRIAQLERGLEERVKSAQAAQSLVDDLERAIDEEKASVQGAQVRIEELEAALGQRAEDLAAANARAETAEEFEQTVETLREESAEAEAQLRDAREELEQAEQRTTELEKTLAEKADALQAAQLRVEELEGAVKQQDGYAEKIEDAEERAAALTAERDGLQRDAETFQARIRELEDSGDLLRDQLEALQDELEELRGRAAAGERVVELRQLLDAERERANILEARLKEEHARGTKAALAKQLADAIQDREEAYEELLSLRNELQRLRAGEPALDSVEQNEAAPQNEETAETEPAPRAPIQILSDSESRGAQRKRGGGHWELIGRILLERGVITLEQLDDALEHQAAAPQRRVGEILVELGYVEERAVAEALAIQCNCECVSFDAAAIDPEAARLVGKRLARQHDCIPIRADEESLVLAMSNPLDLIAIEDFELATKKRVMPVVATRTDIDAAIEAIYF